MAALQAETVRVLMDRFRARFNLPDKLMKDGPLWLESLSQAGLQEEDAARFYEGFVDHWTEPRNPRLHNLLKVLRYGSYGKRPAAPRARSPYALACAFCDDSGGFPVAAPAVLLHTAMTVEELRFTPGQMWPHHLAGDAKGLEAWSVPCKCDTGKRMANSVGFRYSSPAQAEELRELFIPFFIEAAGGRWRLEPGWRLQAWAACLTYRRRARAQNWEPSPRRAYDPQTEGGTNYPARIMANIRGIAHGWQVSGADVPF